MTPNNVLFEFEIESFRGVETDRNQEESGGVNIAHDLLLHYLSFDFATDVSLVQKEWMTKMAEKNDFCGQWETSVR